MSKNILTQASRLLVLDYIAEILYFPVWWYGPGLINALDFFAHGLIEANRFTGLTLLVKNLFKPMFAQYDRQGRIISFFMRLVLIVYKTFVFLLMVIFYLLMLAFWLLLPVLVVWGITYNLPALWLK
jgi:hypothetical protein